MMNIMKCLLLEHIQLLHCHLSFSFSGVSQLVVAINKMDTVGWLKDRYEEIMKKLAQFLKQAGFKENDIAYIPCSGLAGENLTSAPTVDALATWYTGPTLVQQIGRFSWVWPRTLPSAGNN